MRIRTAMAALAILVGALLGPPPTARAADCTPSPGGLIVRCPIQGSPPWSVSFVGTRATIYAPTGPQQGRLWVGVDDQWRLVDLASAAPGWATIETGVYPAGTHTLQLEPETGHTVYVESVNYLAQQPVVCRAGVADVQCPVAP